MSPEERRERNKNWIAAEHHARIPQTEIKVKGVLESLNLKFEIQKEFDDSRYIVDFYLPDYKTIIECDGDYWHNLPGHQESDRIRDKWFTDHEYKIIRLWEHEINEGLTISILKKNKII